jgi:hypothetical protein
MTGMPGSVLLVGHAGGTVGVGVGVGVGTGVGVGWGCGVPPPPAPPAEPPPERPPPERPPREPPASVCGDVGDGDAVGVGTDVGTGLADDVGVDRGVTDGIAAASGSPVAALNVQEVRPPKARTVKRTATTRGDLTRPVFHGGADLFGDLLSEQRPRPCQAGRMRSHHVSRVVLAPPERVYAYASDIENLPDWAAGLAQSAVIHDGDELIVSSPMGEVRVRFVARNDFGVLDHDVKLPSGRVVSNPLRVVTHPNGCEVIFTVRQIDLTDEEFARDISMVEADLERLAERVLRADSQFDAADRSDGRST